MRANGKAVTCLNIAGMVRKGPLEVPSRRVLKAAYEFSRLKWEGGYSEHREQCMVRRVRPYGMLENCKQFGPKR